MVLEMAGSIKVCLYIELRLITKNHVQKKRGHIRFMTVNLRKLCLQDWPWVGI